MKNIKGSKNRVTHAIPKEPSFSEQIMPVQVRKRKQPSLHTTICSRETRTFTLRDHLDILPKPRGLTMDNLIVAKEYCVWDYYTSLYAKVGIVSKLERLEFESALSTPLLSRNITETTERPAYRKRRAPASQHQAFFTNTGPVPQANLALRRSQRGELSATVLLAQSFTKNDNEINQKIKPKPT